MPAPLDRRVLGSWLEGPRAGAEAQGVVLPPRGERLGLPASGSGSVARPARRIGAFLIDSAAAVLVVLATGVRPADPGYSWLVLIAFGTITAATLGLMGRTFGHAALHLHLVDLRGSRAQPLRVLLRQVLLCLLVPACIWDADGRGLHDKAAGTVLVRD